jgi:hypothetical protein
MGMPAKGGVSLFIERFPCAFEGGYYPARRLLQLGEGAMKYTAIAACLTVLLLSACKTPYQPAGFGGGFSEKKLNDTTYVVKFDGNGHTEKSRVVRFWFYRCAELTRQKGFNYFTIGFDEGANNDTVPEGSYFQAALYTPDDRSTNIIKVHGSGGGMVFVPGGTVTRWHDSGVVHMYYATPTSQPGVYYVAQVILDALQPYIQSDGNVAGPTLDEVARKATLMVAPLPPSAASPGPAPIQPYLDPSTGKPF